MAVANDTTGKESAMFREEKVPGKENRVERENPESDGQEESLKLIRAYEERIDEIAEVTRDVQSLVDNFREGLILLAENLQRGAAGGGAPQGGDIKTLVDLSLKDVQEKSTLLNSILNDYLSREKIIIIKMKNAARRCIDFDISEFILLNDAAITSRQKRHAAILTLLKLIRSDQMEMACAIESLQQKSEGLRMRDIRDTLRALDLSRTSGIDPSAWSDSCMKGESAAPGARLILIPQSAHFLARAS
jgi:hypothetical protein